MNEDTAVDCMKAGAWDYIIKEHIKRLGPAVQNSLKQKTLRLERKLAESLIQEQNALLLSLINSPKEITIFSLDRNCCYTSFNDRHRNEMKRVWGVDIMKGMNLFECLKDPAIRDTAKRSSDRALHGESFTEIQHHPGPDTYYELNWNPIFHGKDVAGLTVFMINITERKRDAAEKERLMTAIEQAAETIMITDVNGSIEYVNPVFEQTTGYASAEVLGQNPRLLKSGKHDVEFYTLMWNTLTKGGTWRGRLVNKKKDGSLISEEASISPIRDSHGTIINYVGIKSDITAQLALEEQYRQSQKMEAVGQLAGGIAHDFNNILQTITGFCEMLEMGMDQQLSAHPDDASGIAAHRKEVGEISKAAQLAVGLVRQLLDFSRKQPEEYEEVNLNDALTEGIGLLRQAAGKGVRLEFDLSPDPLPISGDQAQIIQIMMNLVLNARDAMPDGGEIRVTTERVLIRDDEVAGVEQSRAGAFACLLVADSGDGMNEDQLAHLFEPFYTSKDVGKGTGLGLAVAYGIVQNHKGWINVSSVAGSGAAFEIYIPLRV